MIIVVGGDIVVVLVVVAGIVVDELTCNLSAWISRHQTRERCLVDESEL